MRTRLLFGVVAGLVAASCLGASETAENENCRIVSQQTRVDLHSRFFVLHLDTASGLRAVAWENRLTGRKISVSNGPELEFDIGLPDKPLQTPQLEVAKVEVKGEGETS